MTYEAEAEVRRPSVGTKVLIFGFAILAVLGSFWTIVWFIRSYVEPPRVGIPMALAARDSADAPAPQPATPDPPAANDSQVAESAPEPAAPKAARGPIEAPPAAAAVADRWLPMQVAPPADPAPVGAAVPAALAATPDPDAIEEVAEGSVPAIAGPAPLPRRKPTLASAAKRMDPPLPRPRPDGPAPQSVWTAVPTTDDRFPQQ